MVTSFYLTKYIAVNCHKFAISPVSKLVLIYLSCCYNKKNKYVFPKQKTIADRLGVNRTSVVRAINELEKIELITKKRGYTNLYEINISKFLTSDVQNSDIECSKIEPPYRTYKEKIKEHTFSQNSYNASVEKTQELLRSYRENREQEDYTSWNKERAIEHLRKGVPRGMLKFSKIAKYLMEKFSISYEYILSG